MTVSIRTAVLKSRSKTLETVSIMKTRVNGSTNLPSMMTQVAEQLFVADKNHLVLDVRYGMKENESADGKIWFSRADAGTREREGLDDECDPAAWPEGLPTYSLESVLHEAIRISSTVRHGLDGHLLCHDV